MIFISSYFYLIWAIFIFKLFHYPTCNAQQDEYAWENKPTSTEPSSNEKDFFFFIAQIIFNDLKYHAHIPDIPRLLKQTFFCPCACCGWNCKHRQSCVIIETCNTARVWKSKADHLHFPSCGRPLLFCQVINRSSPNNWRWYINC